MAYLKINQDKLTAETATLLVNICPFSAISYFDDKLDISAACKMCKLCIKKGPLGVIEMVENYKGSINKKDWRGIAIFVEHNGNQIHNVALELIGKASELASVIGHPVYALMIGSNIEKLSRKLLYYDVDKVFVYDSPFFDECKIDIYANAFNDFIAKIKPSSIIVGATNIGRSLAPRVAARWRTGLTADCTILEMKENSDLVQIRPAFGGNIMARIVTTKHRPQFCTVRYKMFSTPLPQSEPSGEIVSMSLPNSEMKSVIDVLEKVSKPREVDISEAEIIVAIGRGFKSKNDIALAERLAELLGGVTACTRPLVENGWFDAKRQIGLSGRTVKAKLIITIGISGAVQFTSSMSESDLIIAINEDPQAAIFDIANYGLCGDLYQIIPALLDCLRGSGDKEDERNDRDCL